MYADLKILNPEKARRLTGVSSEGILENLRRLLTEPLYGSVIIRTPLIPGLTAAEENIREAARFLAGCRPDIPWEFLNYNPLAPAKYALAGRTFSLPEDLKPFSADEMEEFVRLAEEEGVTGAYWDLGEDK